MHYLCRGVEASVFRLATDVLWAVKAAETVVVMAALGALVQFAYRFLESRTRGRRGRRSSPGLAVVVAAGLAAAVAAGASRDH